MVGFHMMHQNARKRVFPLTRENRVGTLLMFAVRNIFSQPERLRATMRDLAAAGEVPQWLAESRGPAGLSDPSGRRQHRCRRRLPLRAARARRRCRAVRHRRPGALRTNIASILKPPLPAADRRQLAGLFGHLVGVGLDAPPPRAAPPVVSYTDVEALSSRPRGRGNRNRVIPGANPGGCYSAARAPSAARRC